MWPFALLPVRIIGVTSDHHDAYTPSFAERSCVATGVMMDIEKLQKKGRPFTGALALNFWREMAGIS